MVSRSLSQKALSFAVGLIFPLSACAARKSFASAPTCRKLQVMGSGFSFNISHTALLAMDCQAGIISAYAKPEAEFVERATRVVSAARAAKMPVIHVQVGFRPSLPEVSDRNRLFSA